MSAQENSTNPQGRRISRRRFLQGTATVGAVSALGPLLAACVAPAQTEDAPTTAGSDATPGRGVTVAYLLEPTTIDPAQVVHRVSSVSLVNVVENLVDMDQDAMVRPGLAESWESNEDGTEWTFHLRSGITFHDGEPFNAEAVKFNIDRIVDPETRSQTGVAQLGPFDRAEVVDDLTVTLYLTGPYAPFLGNIAISVLGMVFGMNSPKAVEEFGEEYAQNPVGTGPFKFVEWIKGDRIELERYEDYVSSVYERNDHEGPAYLPTFTARTIPEAETRLSALLNGEIDYMFDVPVLDVEDLRSNPDVTLSERMFAGAPTMLLINRQLAPTDDLSVAKAVEFAVDREVITQIVTNGVSPVAWGPLKPVNWAYNPEVESLYSYDPDMARQLLDEAGWVPGADGIREKDGQVGRLVTFTLSDPIRISFLEAIQGMLRDVGLDLDIQAMSLAASEDLARQGLCSLTFMDWTGVDPDILSVHYHSSNIGGWNMGYYDDPELDELLEAARTEIDSDTRLEMYQRAQMIIMENAATLPLFNRLQVDAHHADLEGISYDTVNWLPFWYDARWSE